MLGGGRVFSQLGSVILPDIYSLTSLLIFDLLAYLVNIFPTHNTQKHTDANLFSTEGNFFAPVYKSMATLLKVDDLLHASRPSQGHSTSKQRLKVKVINKRRIMHQEVKYCNFSALNFLVNMREPVVGRTSTTLVER